MPEKVLVTREIPDAGLRLLRDFDVAVLAEGRPSAKSSAKPRAGPQASSPPSQRGWTRS